MTNENTLIESEVTCEIVVTRADGTVEPMVLARAVRSRSRWAIFCDLLRHVSRQIGEAIRQWKDDADTDL